MSGSRENVLNWLDQENNKGLIDVHFAITAQEGATTDHLFQAINNIELDSVKESHTKWHESFPQVDVRKFLHMN